MKMNDESLRPSGEQEFVGEKSNRVGAVNMALLFGTAAIALSLIVTPMLAPDKDRIEASTMGYDDIKTGSIPAHDGKVKHYTIRRSVLQETPGEVCIIDQNGNKSGC
jgi:hypothetical protein